MDERAPGTVATRTVRVAYFAAAAEAAGRTSETLVVPVGATVADLKVRLRARYGDAMETVVACASFLADGTVTRDDDLELGASIDVLPPFAGG